MLDTSTSHPVKRGSRGPFLDDLLDAALRLERRKIAMVYPCDITSIKTSRELQSVGVGTVVLVGPRGQLLELARSHQIDLSQFEVIDSGSDAPRAAEIACTLARSGDVDMVMKGSLHTDDLMRTVVSRANGLRTNVRISHAFVLQIPDRQQPLIISDSVVNVAPTLAEKIEILEKTIRLACKIGLQRPRVAVISFTESVMHTVQSTVDAAVVSKMAERGQLRGAVVDGPLAFDDAISLISAKSKGIESTVAGNAEILLMSNLEAGNALYKSLIYMARASCAGVVLGTQKPVILTSRTDSMESKVYSTALGSLMLGE